MTQPPIIKTMDDMLAKLTEAARVYRESEKAVAEYTAAVRALAQVCEDEELKNEYLLRLEELSGKPGFVDAIRSVLKVGVAVTPKHVRDMIILTNKMNLSGYSNAMASIHTTLRRMKKSGEVEEVQNSKGEKAYRLLPSLPGSPGTTLPNAIDVARELHDRLANDKLKPQERFKLAHTKGRETR